MATKQYKQLGCLDVDASSDLRIPSAGRDGNRSVAVRGHACEAVPSNGISVSRDDCQSESSDQDRYSHCVGVEIRTDRPSPPQKEKEES